jgi:hypothetical protein
MKRYIPLAIISSVTVIVLMADCKKKAQSVTSACDGIACTMLFAMVNITVSDSVGNTISPDDVYTLRVDNQDTIRTSTSSVFENSYTIIDDNYLPKMRNSKHDFRFICKKNGKTVVDEPFTLSADCCHISKVSGKASLIVKL